MLNFIIQFVISVVIISLLVYILPGIKTTKFYCAIVVGVAISLLNLLISPLLQYFTVQATALLFGLLIVMIDAVLLFVFGKILKGVKVDGFGWAFVFSVILSLVIYVVELIFKVGFFER
nr:phage holin family protein [Bacteroidota bacterium]